MHTYNAPQDGQMNDFGGPYMPMNANHFRNQENENFRSSSTGNDTFKFMYGKSNGNPQYSNATAAKSTSPESKYNYGYPHFHDPTNNSRVAPSSYSAVGGSGPSSSVSQTRFVENNGRRGVYDDGDESGSDEDEEEYEDDDDEEEEEEDEETDEEYDDMVPESERQKQFVDYLHRIGEQYKLHLKGLSEAKRTKEDILVQKIKKGKPQISTGTRDILEQKNYPLEATPGEKNKALFDLAGPQRERKKKKKEHYQDEQLKKMGATFKPKLAKGSKENNGKLTKEMLEQQGVLAEMWRRKKQKKADAVQKAEHDRAVADLASLQAAPIITQHPAADPSRRQGLSIGEHLMMKEKERQLKMFLKTEELYGQYSFQPQMDFSKNNISSAKIDSRSASTTMIENNSVANNKRPSTATKTMTPRGNKSFAMRIQQSHGSATDVSAVTHHTHVNTPTRHARDARDAKRIEDRAKPTPLDGSSTSTKKLRKSSFNMRIQGRKRRGGSESSSDSSSSSSDDTISSSYSSSSYSSSDWSSSDDTSSDYDEDDSSSSSGSSDTSSESDSSDSDTHRKRRKTTEKNKKASPSPSRNKKERKGGYKKHGESDDDSSRTRDFYLQKKRKKHDSDYEYTFTPNTYSHFIDPLKEQGVPLHDRILRRGEHYGRNSRKKHQTTTADRNNAASITRGDREPPAAPEPSRREVERMRKAAKEERASLSHSIMTDILAERAYKRRYDHKQQQNKKSVGQGSEKSIAERLVEDRHGSINPHLDDDGVTAEKVTARLYGDAQIIRRKRQNKIKENIARIQQQSVQKKSIPLKQPKGKPGNASAKAKDAKGPLLSPNDMSNSGTRNSNQTQDFLSRMKIYEKQKNQHRKELVEQRKAVEDEEFSQNCTFAPQLTAETAVLATAASERQSHNASPVDLQNFNMMEEGTETEASAKDSRKVTPARTPSTAAVRAATTSTTRTSVTNQRFMERNKLWKQKRDNELDELRRDLDRQKAVQEAQDCTYHPTIRPYNPAHKSPPSAALSSSRRERSSSPGNNKSSPRATTAPNTSATMNHSMHSSVSTINASRVQSFVDKKYEKSIHNLSPGGNANYRRALRPPVSSHDVVESLDEDSIIPSRDMRLTSHEQQQRSSSRGRLVSPSPADEGSQREVSRNRHTAEKRLFSKQDDDDGDLITQHHFYNQYAPLLNEHEKRLLSQSTQVVQKVEEQKHERTSYKDADNYLAQREEKQKHREDRGRSQEIVSTELNRFAEEAAKIAARVSLTSTMVPYDELKDLRKVPSPHRAQPTEGQKRTVSPRSPAAELARPRTVLQSPGADDDRKSAAQEHNRLLDYYFNFQAMQQKRDAATYEP